MTSFIITIRGNWFQSNQWSRYGTLAANLSNILSLTFQGKAGIHVNVFSELKFPKFTDDFGTVYWNKHLKAFALLFHSNGIIVEKNSALSLFETNVKETATFAHDVSLYQRIRRRKDYEMGFIAFGFMGRNKSENSQGVLSVVTQYLRQSLNEKQHAWLHVQQVTSPKKY